MKHRLKECGFTLIELVIVIAIATVVFALPAIRRTTTQYWREEGAVRRLSETLVLLHRQAITDGVFYRIEFDLSREHPTYRVGEIVAEEEDSETVRHLSTAESEAGFCAVQLAKFSSPDEGRFQSVMPPRSFPSLANAVVLPKDTYFEAVITMRGKINARTGVRPYILFSPRGFSEFAVIHLQLSRPNNKVTILVNPFTGLTDIYRDSEFKDFEWTYGRTKKQ